MADASAREVEEGITYAQQQMRQKPHPGHHRRAVPPASEPIPTVPAGKPNQSYGYTKDDRVETITVGKTVTEMAITPAGRWRGRWSGQHARTAGQRELLQGPDGYLTKHYFAGGVRIAPSRGVRRNCGPFRTWFHPFHS
ncbi:MAG: hypothetical protein U0587_12815 [Candidatus Binatia bacterium]